MAIPYSDSINALDAVTASVANTDAPKIDCSLRMLKSIQFSAASISSGNGVFGLEVSNDGINWVVYNRLIPNVVGTNAQTNAAVAAPTLSSNTSAIYFFPLGDHFRYMRVFVTRTTDGTYTAALQMG